MHDDIIRRLRTAPRTGQTMAEYATILAITFMIAVAGYSFFAADLGAKIAGVVSDIAGVM